MGRIRLTHGGVAGPDQDRRQDQVVHQVLAQVQLDVAEREAERLAERTLVRTARLLHVALRQLRPRAHRRGALDGVVARAWGGLDLLELREGLLVEDAEPGAHQHQVRKRALVVERRTTRGHRVAGHPGRERQRGHGEQDRRVGQTTPPAAQPEHDQCEHHSESEILRPQIPQSGDKQPGQRRPGKPGTTGPGEYRARQRQQPRCSQELGERLGGVVAERGVQPDSGPGAMNQAQAKANFALRRCDLSRPPRQSIGPAARSRS